MLKQQYRFIKRSKAGIAGMLGNATFTLHSDHGNTAYFIVTKYTLGNTSRDNIREYLNTQESYNFNASWRSIERISQSIKEEVHRVLTSP